VTSIVSEHDLLGPYSRRGGEFTGSPPPVPEMLTSKIFNAISAYRCSCSCQYCYHNYCIFFSPKAFGVRVSQVKPSNCFRLHPTSMISKHATIPVPDSLYRLLEKLVSRVSPSIFDTSLSSLMIWNLQSYPTTVLNERMWHFRGSKPFGLAPPTFRGHDPQAPRIYALAALTTTSRVLWK